MSSSAKRAPDDAEVAQPMVADDNGNSKKRKKKSKKPKVKEPKIFLIDPRNTNELKLKAVQQVFAAGLGLTRTKSRLIGISHQEAVGKYAVVVVQGLGRDLYRQHCGQLSCLEFFAKAHSIKLPGNKGFIYSCAESLLQIMHTKQEQELALAAQTRRNESIVKNGGIDIEHYFVSPAMAEQHAFPKPLPDGSLPPGFIRLTKMATGDAQMYGFDCEMCVTDAGRELTRVSIVGPDHSTVYDELVKPPNPIRDYCTKYSGITAKLLQDVRKTLEDVQRDLQDLLPTDAVLVGHSPEYDLRALKLVHNRVIDTALLYQDARGPTFKCSLRKLVKEYLRRSIQQSETGHCSTEDAVAALELAQAKLHNGPEFGHIPQQKKSVLDTLGILNKRATVIDSQRVIGRHPEHQHLYFPCDSDQEVAEKGVLPETWESSLVWINFNGINDHFRAATSESAEDLEGKTEGTGGTEGLSQVIDTLNNRLGSILTSVPPKTVLFVIGTGSMATAEEMYKRKCRFPDLWTKENDQLHCKEVDKARKGLLFFTVT